MPRPLDEVPGLSAERVKRDYSLVKNEVTRMTEFAELAENAMESSELIWKIKDTYNIEED